MVREPVALKLAEQAEPWGAGKHVAAHHGDPWQTTSTSRPAAKRASSASARGSLGTGLRPLLSRLNGR